MQLISSKVAKSFIMVFFIATICQAQDGFPPQTVCDILTDMPANYSYGNACNETMLDCNVEFINMNGYTLELLKAHIVVQGNIINQGTILFNCDEAVLEVLGTTLSAETAKMEVKIYPNPATDVVHIKANNLKHITLTDVTGRVLKRYTTVVNNNSINITNLSQGIYFIILEDDSGRRETKKLIKI